MIGLLAKKIGMTQIFDQEGRQVPVTLIDATTCHVTGLRSKEKDGYFAVQLGLDPMKEKRATKSRLGVAKKLHLPAMRFVREIRTADIEGVDLAKQVDVSMFEPGDYVDVTGVSIGKGFQGVVKRHDYKGGEAAHGSKMGREPGGIGSRAGGNGCRKKLRKGKLLPGHMGQDKITVQNLAIVQVDADNGILALRGAVPGAEGTCLVVRMALKKPAQGRKWKLKGESKVPAVTPAAEETQAGSETAADQS